MVNRKILCHGKRFFLVACSAPGNTIWGSVYSMHASDDSYVVSIPQICSVAPVEVDVSDRVSLLDLLITPVFSFLCVV